MYTRHELVITAGDEFSAVEIQFSNEDDRGFSLLANDLSRPPVKCLLTLKQLYALNRNIEKAIWYANSIGYKED